MLLFLLSFLSLGPLALRVAGIATDPTFSQLQGRAFVSGNWGLTQPGITGVSAMQLAVMSESTVIILDKTETNPLKLDDGRAAWVSELNLNTNQYRALNAKTNTFCATGSFLGNGTFVSSGGTVNANALTEPTEQIEGLQAIRLFTPCTDGTCDIVEDPTRLHLTSKRWYPSSVRLDDGSVMIYGGSTNSSFQNGANISNPTYEFFPPKNINGFNGVQIPNKFLNDTLNANHFPIMMLLPSGNIFVAANRQAMLFNWRNNTEVGQRLPEIPNGIRVTSPYSAGAVLLPLTPENNYTPEVMICGGSNVSDAINPLQLSSQTPASTQCARMVLTPQGIAADWTVEDMPQPRVMPELILLPDGRILIVNGAQTGVAGEHNVGDQIGESNADNPALTPVIYDPSAAPGHRFSSDGIPATTIPRMYHSTSSLTPNGSVLLAGSNPNSNFTTDQKFSTEYRYEFYSPPYMFQPRPTYTGLPATVDYNSQFQLSVDLPFMVDIILTLDCSFATHGVHMDQRYLKLKSILSLNRTILTVTGPPSARHYPPGPAYLYVVTSAGVPSFGHRTLIGTGASPPQ
ncbi:hypothetical protein K435DRAFT_673254 [Dendrothele bispora CBS 962.96]|uniref:Copper radical oxidase n=1 Tax=Dendrothele bispora (strain CBS 962.96) TaxID=1314807 RepID=A0A4V4HEP2_DENBC|nr:hypothetical protein K435DRAFT_673254 [Dendrothele bispora CBS 962.96]